MIVHLDYTRKRCLFGLYGYIPNVFIKVHFWGPKLFIYVVAHGTVLNVVVVVETVPENHSKT